MSALLFSETPIVIPPSLARMITLNGAMALQQLHYMLENSDQDKLKVLDGKKWYKATRKKWKNYLLRGLLSESTTKRLLCKLRLMGLLLSRNDLNEDTTNDYNDVTLWWSIDYDKLNELYANSSSKPAKTRKIQSKQEIKPLVHFDPRHTDTPTNTLGQSDPTPGVKVTQPLGQSDPTPGVKMNPLLKNNNNNKESFKRNDLKKQNSKSSYNHDDNQSDAHLENISPYIKGKNNTPTNAKARTKRKWLKLQQELEVLHKHDLQGYGDKLTYIQELASSCQSFEELLNNYSEEGYLEWAGLTDGGAEEEQEPQYTPKKPTQEQPQPKVQSVVKPVVVKVNGYDVDLDDIADKDKITDEKWMEILGGLDKDGQKEEFASLIDVILEKDMYDKVDKRFKYLVEELFKVI